jgi:hypothetical protein
MIAQMMEVQIPSVLLQRARVSAMDEARDLITFLLESYVQEMERKQLFQSYEAYYATRQPDEAAEEEAILTDFAFADAEIELRTDA